MKKLKHSFPQIEVCWVTTLKRHWLTRRYPDAAKLIKKVRAANLDGFDLCANAAVTAALIKKIQTAGLKVYVWTVDTPAIAKKFALAGLDGLTTNRPAEIRAATAAVL
jgi:glycerophosphoryl diester phosphodiesterase